MSRLQIACVVGARPNFMKMAPLLWALEGGEYANEVATTLIHTGQHYDKSLSGIFFEELNVRSPDISLEVGSASHAGQTARIMERMKSALMNGGENKQNVLIV